ncbi:hypothetical protein FGO68_gene1347 [Halteria grandinella]|uniref:Sel1 repeat family protein n=1 Tax=Halteria grandinella TaxID=5974 RepID=A0A8J8NBH2_HALGN|nr:hypothetical protein FGO68_gene1347 [Halteria grandinella]
MQKETEDEATLKLGDFHYYGTALKQDYSKAVDLYKQVVSTSRQIDLRGHAMLNLGMMHHFGLGTPIDLDMAQIYYDKAMKEEASTSTHTGSSSYMTPIYLLNLYSKWQRLDIIETVQRFFLFGSNQSNATSLDGSWTEMVPRSQMLVILAIIGYWLTLAGMVKFLRRDYTGNNN